MFDTDTGQVFREWTIPRQMLVAQPEQRGWDRRRPYPPFPSRSTHGPRSLVDMAITTIADNIGDVPAAYFDAIPPRLIWRIWRFLEARGVCLHAWKIVSKILLDEDDEKNLGLYRFRHHICRATEPLTVYTSPLRSPSIDFIAHLVISGGCSFGTHDMLCLSEMKNLGVLELIQPADEVKGDFPRISDRLVRGWTEQEDPFPLLRILRIWGDQSTTQESLQWVAKFPSLALYDVMGSREDWASPQQYAQAASWELADPTSGLEDSLLRYLMLFAPGEETGAHRLKDFARSVDSDLTSICSDSRCAVKFVPDRQAPPLLDFLTDNAKVYVPSWDPDSVLREARACHGVAFEPWAFWLYSFIGQLSEDFDLRQKEANSGRQAVVGPFVLPSKPFACLHLGHSGRGGIAAKPSYVSRGLFATKRFTFTRSNAFRSFRAKPPTLEGVMVPKGSAATTTTRVPNLSVRRQKRKRLDDVLQGFSS